MFLYECMEYWNYDNDSSIGYHMAALATIFSTKTSVNV